MESDCTIPQPLADQLLQVVAGARELVRTLKDGGPDFPVWSPAAADAATQLRDSLDQLQGSVEQLLCR